MTMALTPAHLERYKQIVRLLYKYGNRDALRGAGLEDPGLEEPPSASAARPSILQVHPVTGEILERQREGNRTNGQPRRPLDTESEDEAHALARQLADDLEAMDQRGVTAKEDPLLGGLSTMKPTQDDLDAAVLDGDRHGAIVQRAYEIWVSRGRPEGTDLVCWLEAESEIDGIREQGERGGLTRFETPLTS